ncbi:MAG: hypothetical protein ABI306_11720 [Caulobacteraceae bacterium]
MSSDSTLAGEGDPIERLLAADAASPLDATRLADLIALLAKANRDQQASLYAARLLKLRPTHRRALRALTRSPRPDADIVGGWRALAETAPGDAEPWLQMARLASRAGDAQGALAASEAVLVRDTGHLEGLTLKVGASIALNLHDDIGPAWRQLHEADAETAGAILIRAADGTDADAAAALVGAAVALGALDEEGEHRRLRLRARLTVDAYEAEVAGDALAATQNFKRLTRLEPSVADYTDGLRRALGRLRARIDAAGGEPDAELAAWARALAHFEPGHRNAYLVIGRAGARTGDWGEAAEAFTQALAVGEAEGALFLEHAGACARGGRLVEAVQSWNRAEALARDSREPLARVTRAREELRGLAVAAHQDAVERRDWRAAWASLAALADLDEDAQAQDERAGRLLKETGKALSEAAGEHRPEAVDLALLYLEQAPADGRARLFLGRALVRERRNAEALDVWQALAADRPDSVEPNLQIARLAKRMSEAELGRGAADAVLALEPGHVEAQSLRTHFDQPASMG